MIPGIPLTNNSSATTQALTLTLGGAATTTYPTATVYSHIVPSQSKTVTGADGSIAGDPSEYRRAPEFTLLTAATKTTIAAAPPSGSVKIITGVCIHNPDTVSMTITVAIDDNGTSRIQCKVTLLTLEALYYGNGEWYAVDANGNRKEALAAASNWAVSGNLTVAGNTTLGDAAADSLTVNAGVLSMPNIPAFAVEVGTQIDNVTGDATVYTVIFGTERFDQGANYNTGTGQFTAPVAGKYSFSTGIFFTGLAAGNTSSNISIVTSNATYRGLDIAVGTAQIGGDLMFSHSVSCVDMDAGDVAYITVQIGGLTKVVDIFTASHFTGHQVC